MTMPSIGSIASVAATPALLPSAAPTPSSGAGSDFGKMLSDLMGGLQQTEQSTNNLVTQAATGRDVDVHDVMIATQTENLAFDTALQVRNKLVEAYQDVMRMQM
jgi:flagellar hook-basal body complex protein FliE